MVTVDCVVFPTFLEYRLHDTARQSMVSNSKFAALLMVDLIGRIGARAGTCRRQFFASARDCQAWIGLHLALLELNAQVARSSPDALLDALLPCVPHLYRQCQHSYVEMRAAVPGRAQGLLIKRDWPYLSGCNSRPPDTPRNASIRGDILKHQEHIVKTFGMFGMLGRRGWALRTQLPSICRHEMQEVAKEML